MTPKIEEKSEKKIDDEIERMMALMKKETQQLSNYLKENKITLEN